MKQIFKINTKLSKLDSIIRESGKCAIAFSGGVDSSFLLFRANQISGKKVVAITARTPYMAAHETEESIEFTSKYGINHQIIDIPIPEIIRFNPADRCYFCKKTLFSHIVRYANNNGFDSIFDGTNVDDMQENRPGVRALKEMAITSPLAEAGMTKEDIRKYAKKFDLSVWAKQSMSCLLTRIPHETEITSKMLNMIEKAETVLFEHGYPGSRIRIHGTTARIECIPGYIGKLANDPHRDNIVELIKKTGFSIVSIDLEGHRKRS